MSSRKEHSKHKPLPDIFLVPNISLGITLLTHAHTHTSYNSTVLPWGGESEPVLAINLNKLRQM